jgi:hypothetical protein
VAGSRRWLRTVLALLPAVAGADEVHLTSGGVVRGVIVGRTDQAVLIETGPGRVTLPLAQVSRIVDGGSALATFQERAARIAFDDVRPPVAKLGGGPAEPSAPPRGASKGSSVRD